MEIRSFLFINLLYLFPFIEILIQPCHELYNQSNADKQIEKAACFSKKDIRKFSFIIHQLRGLSWKASLLRINFTDEINSLFPIYKDLQKKLMVKEIWSIRMTNKAIDRWKLFQSFVIWNFYWKVIK